MMSWERAIILIIASRGGRAYHHQVNRDVPNFRVLSEKNLRTSKYGPYPAYHDDVRSHLSNLDQKGLTRHVKDGLHELTPAGWELANGLLASRGTIRVLATGEGIPVRL